MGCLYKVWRDFKVPQAYDTTMFLTFLCDVLKIFQIQGYAYIFKTVSTL